MQTKTIHFAEFVFIVAMLMAMVALTINMMLPAFDEISKELHINEQHVHLSISLLYLGLGISQVLFGPISDRFGRKPAIYLGLLTFSIGCTVSFIAPNLTSLVAGQIIQGIGLGAPRTLSIAIVRDRFKGAQMAKTMSFIMIVYLITPVLSPIMGQLIISAYGWRMLFTVFILTSLLLYFLIRCRMPETLIPSKKGTLDFKHLWSATRHILGTRSSVGFISILGIHSGVFIAYLNLSQSIYESHYSLGNNYPYYFALMAMAIGIASYINGKIVICIGMRTIVTYTLIAESIITLTFLILYWMGYDGFLGFLIFMFLQLMGYGFIIGNITALAMEPLDTNTGLGSAIIGAISTILATPISLVIGFMHHDGPSSLVWGFLMAALMGLIINGMVYSQKPNPKLNV